MSATPRAVNSDGVPIGGLAATVRAAPYGGLELAVVPAHPRTGGPVCAWPPPAGVPCALAVFAAAGGAWELVAVTGRDAAKNELRLQWNHGGALTAASAHCGACGRAQPLVGAGPLPAELAPYRLAYSGAYPWLPPEAGDVFAANPCGCGRRR